MQSFGAVPLGFVLSGHFVIFMGAWCRRTLVIKLNDVEIFHDGKFFLIGKKKLCHVMAVWTLRLEQGCVSKLSYGGEVRDDSSVMVRVC